MLRYSVGRGNGFFFTHKTNKINSTKLLNDILLLLRYDEIVQEIFRRHEKRKLDSNDKFNVNIGSYFVLYTHKDQPGWMSYSLYELIQTAKNIPVAVITDERGKIIYKKT